jgi:hypothetical protein
MPRTQAVFLLAATMFGGVAQAAPGGSVPNFNVKAASRALALVPEARIIDLWTMPFWPISVLKHLCC